MKYESLVLEHLGPYIDHQLKYRRFTLLYNGLNRLNKFSWAVIVSLGLIGSGYLMFLDIEINLVDYLLMLLLANVNLSILTILARELITYLYGLRYGENFKSYVTVQKSDVDKLFSKLTRNDETMQSDFMNIVKKVKHENNIIYMIITSGFDKKIIKNLFELEYRYQETRKAN